MESLQNYASVQSLLTSVRKSQQDKGAYFSSMKAGISVSRTAPAPD
jgi:hypothetical protein